MKLAGTSCAARSAKAWSSWAKSGSGDGLQQRFLRDPDAGGRGGRHRRGVPRLIEDHRHLADERG
jgi:hypothetical protein